MGAWRAPSPYDRQTARKKNDEGLAALRRGALDDAEAAFAGAAAADPSDAEIATNHANVLARQNNFEAAESAYRRALSVAPDRWLAYTGIADLWAQDPSRWERRDHMRDFLEMGLSHLAADSTGRINLVIRLAHFERTVGYTADARRRLQSLLATETPSARQSSRVQEVMSAIDADEQVRALADWPEPEVSHQDHERAALWMKRLYEGDNEEALRQAEALTEKHPDWWRARWLRSLARLSMGRLDDAIVDLNVLVQLAPSHAGGWRQLGELLAENGGRSDMLQADGALSRALALDPAAVDLWLLKARVALRLGRVADANQAIERYKRVAPAHADRNLVRELERRAQQKAAEDPGHAIAASAASPPTPPSEEARALYAEAIEWLEIGDPAKLAPGRLAQALAASPGYVDAAIAHYGLSGVVPEKTVDALWQSADGLYALATGILATGLPQGGRSSPDENERKRRVAARNLIRPWLDRAVLLGHVEALFERALVQHQQQDGTGALADLRRYIARDPAPPRLAEASALRAAMVTSQGSRALQVRMLLAGQQVVEARNLLGGACDPGRDPDTLWLLAQVNEFTGDLDIATQCLLALIAQSPAAGNRGGADAGLDQATAVGEDMRTRVLGSLVQVALRGPPQLGSGIKDHLQQAVDAGIESAGLALALALEADPGTNASSTAQRIELLRRYLTRKPEGGSDSDQDRATAMLQRLQSTRSQERNRERILMFIGALSAAILVFAWAAARYRGKTVARALQKRPALYAEVATAVEQIRHDILKHRTSVLSLLGRDRRPGDAPVDREAMAKTLLEPEATSVMLATIYTQLDAAARGQGVPLRPLAREPVFGPLLQDLSAAERTVTDARRDSELASIDGRLRGEHHDQLSTLLAMGPRTRLDAATLELWIGAVRSEWQGGDNAHRPWNSPALHIEDVNLDFPVERLALVTIFTNLLRNAQQAVTPEAGGKTDFKPDGPQIVVRAGTTRDDFGRRLHFLAIGDTAPAHITAEAIESRESGRGLAIVRDLVRQWRGHLKIDEGSSTSRWTKSIAARFPVPGGAPSP